MGWKTDTLPTGYFQKSVVAARENVNIGADIDPELPLTGRIHSSMKLREADIIVDTSCHPVEDAISITIESSLVSMTELSIFLDFPYSDGRFKFSVPYAGIWHQHSVTQLKL